jgi:putative flavoprotein involved in K+ transport
MREVDVLVVGASQAGLAMGYFLKREKTSFVILGKEKRIGDIWRKRYDSLVLFTPRWYSSLPGLPLEGDQNGYPAKDEIADYLESYAARFALPVQLDTEVTALHRIGDFFQAVTTRGEYRARRVVVATGPFQQPLIPNIAEAVSPDVYQVHSSQYANPAQLKPGGTAVIGAGNSGAQIAVELSHANGPVLLASGQPMRFLPLELFGKSVFWWFGKIGFLDCQASSPLGRFLSRQRDPIFGLELRDLAKQGKIMLKPRAVNISDRTVTFADHSTAEIQNIVWATGFVSDFSWIRIAGALDPAGKPVHQRGVSPVAGLYFLGQPWQSTRGSALIGGVGKDAEYLVHQISVKMLN